MSWDETLERVRRAADFCASAGLTRFRIDEEEFEIDVRRTPRAESMTAVANANSGSIPSGSGGLTNGTAAKDEYQKTLKSEFVGIVRFSRPSVSEGSIVSSDRELAWVEALGIRNPVRSGGACRVAEVFVSDGQPVGFGQPLLAIEPQRV